MAEVTDVTGDLTELQIYRRQMEAMWDMVKVLIESVGNDMHLRLGSENLLDVACPTCIRVVGVLEACASIMARTAS